MLLRGGGSYNRKCLSVLFVYLSSTWRGKRWTKSGTSLPFHDGLKSLVGILNYCIQGGVDMPIVRWRYWNLRISGALWVEGGISCILTIALDEEGYCGRKHRGRKRMTSLGCHWPYRMTVDGNGPHHRQEQRQRRRRGSSRPRFDTKVLPSRTLRGDT